MFYVGIARYNCIGILNENAINAINQLTIIDRYPDLFKPLGKVRNEKYKIQLCPDVTPYALSVPWKIHLPLISKADEEFNAF